ncbi:MAG TPA: hypothetical protein VF729_10270, partial [Solirubrobacterales bacterium]
MSPHRDEIDLAADLRGLRPAPRPEFVADLDARAAAGFPARGGAGSPFARIASWLERVPRRRLPAFAGAAATAAIAVATAVVAISEEGSPISDDPQSHFLSEERPGLPSARLPAAQDNGNRMRSEGFERAAQAAESAAGDASPPRSGIQSTYSPALPSSRSGPFAARAARREVERSARIVLATEASGVRAAAARVFETVHGYDGIVMRSSVRDGSAGAAGAVFDLLI